MTMRLDGRVAVSWLRAAAWDVSTRWLWQRVVPE